MDKRGMLPNGKRLPFVAAMAMAAIAVMDAEELSSSGKAVAEVVPKSLIPSHDFAVWILKMIRQLMDAVGLSHGGYMEEIVYTVVVLFVALAIGLLVQRGVLLEARKIVKLRHTPAGKELLAQLVLQVLQLPGKGGLGKVQRFRRPGKALFSGHRQKVLQHTKFHKNSSLYGYSISQSLYACQAYECI